MHNLRSFQVLAAKCIDSVESAATVLNVLFSRCTAFTVLPSTTGAHPEAWRA
jgi:hypothetical protein